MDTPKPFSIDSHLAALLEQARSAEYRARITVGRARAACVQAAGLAAASQVRRQERQAFGAMLARLPRLQDRLVVLCAYCHRRQDGDGWTALPFGMEALLLRRGVIVSHGYCPDCLQSHFYSAG